MAGIAAVIRLNSERRLNTLLAGQTGARLSERIEGDGSIIVAHVGEMRRQHVQRAGPQRQQGARPRKLAVGLTGSAKLQADLFLQPNEDGLFPGFTQTRASEHSFSRDVVTEGTTSIVASTDQVLGSNQERHTKIRSQFRLSFPREG
jgi:hypothetical protein